MLTAYDEEAPDEALAALQAAEVDRRIRFPDSFKHSRRSAKSRLFRLRADATCKFVVKLVY